jgi:hypothetical protein
MVAQRVFFANFCWLRSHGPRNSNPVRIDAEISPTLPPHGGAAMEHWFDRTTKLLAREGVARREILKTAAFAGMASLLPRVSWSQPSPAPCTQTNAGGRRTTTLSRSIAYKGQPLTLTHSSTSLQNSSSKTLVQRVQLGSELIAQVTLDSVLAVPEA